MNNHLPVNLISLYTFAFICIASSYAIKQAYAETSIQISNQGEGSNTSVNVTQNTKSNVTTTNTSNSHTKVTINGQTYVDDTSQSNDSKVNVKVQQNNNETTGTVKYTVNGEEKAINITPGADKKSIKIETDEKETQKPKNNMEAFFKRMEELFSRFTSLFTSSSKKS